VLGPATILEEVSGIANYCRGSLRKESCENSGLQFSVPKFRLKLRDFDAWRGGRSAELLLSEYTTKAKYPSPITASPINHIH
jgi:hypothetical protein